MTTFETKLRVRYAETDRMGYCYYGNFAAYFEVARVEALRTLGITYKDLEDDGIILPVLEYSIKYYKPALYDEELKIETVIEKLEGARIFFSYRTFNDRDDVLNAASTTLVFVDSQTKRPMPPPQPLQALINAAANSSG